MPDRFIVTELVAVPGIATKYHSVVDEKEMEVICSCVVHSANLKGAEQRAQVISKLLNDNVPLDGTIEECLPS